MAGRNTSAASNVAYRVVTGLNYPPDDTRAEPGAVVTNIPAASVQDLLAIGAIVKVQGKPADEEGDL